MTDEKLGTELEAFCVLVTDAADAHPTDSRARAAYVAARSDAATSSGQLVELMRRLSTAQASERGAILHTAARRGGLKNFECPSILELYAPLEPEQNGFLLQGEREAFANRAHDRRR